MGCHAVGAVRVAGTPLKVGLIRHIKPQDAAIHYLIVVYPGARDWSAIQRCAIDIDMAWGVVRGFNGKSPAVFQVQGDFSENGGAKDVLGYARRDRIEAHS